MIKWSVAFIPQHRRRLGEVIRAKRTGARFSQEKLAEKAEIHPKYLSEVERGNKTISVDALLRVAKALKSTVEELVRGF